MTSENRKNTQNSAQQPRSRPAQGEVALEKAVLFVT